MLLEQSMTIGKSGEIKDWGRVYDKIYAIHTCKLQYNTVTFTEPYHFAEHPADRLDLQRLEDFALKLDYVYIKTNLETCFD